MQLGRWIVLGAVSLFIAACSGSSASPAPTPSVTGTWSGILGQPMSGSALRLTWQATQTGANVTGPATLLKPATNVPAVGIMEGTLAGNELSLRYTAQGGTVTGFPTCVISGTGSATLSQSTLTGTLTATFTSCFGTGLEPPDSTQLTLTRQ
jgi:hypothetical protein